MIKNHNNSIIVFLVFIYILPSSICMAQPEENDSIYTSTISYEQNNLKNKTLRKNSAYFELFGNGFNYSIGYDRIFWSEDIHKFSTAIGFSYKPRYKLGGRGSYYYIPAEINYLIGKKYHFELGLGITFLLWLKNAGDLSDTSDTAFTLFSRIGYRYQKKDGGVLFRIGFTPFMLIDVPWNHPIIPHVGITIGWTF